MKKNIGIILIACVVLFGCVSGPNPAPPLEFNSAVKGFQSVTLQKGMSPYDRSESIKFGVFVRDGAAKNREAIKVWLTEFTTPSAGAFAAGGLPFTIRKSGESYAVSFTSKPMPVVTRLLSVDPIGQSHLYARFEVLGGNQLLPPVKDSPGLYFFRGILIEDIEAQKADIREADFFAEKVLIYMVSQMENKGVTLPASGTMYMAENTMREINAARVVFQVSFYADFK
ncbi:MAG: hypothetical protein JW904_00120 [Spirochaetales bacterium]|nr:hypothetical protein [Spirochaetales bacterium]